MKANGRTSREAGPRGSRSRRAARAEALQTNFKARKELVPIKKTLKALQQRHRKGITPAKEAALTLRQVPTTPPGENGTGRVMQRNARSVIKSLERFARSDEMVIEDNGEIVPMALMEDNEGPSY